MNDMQTYRFFEAVSERGHWNQPYIGHKVAAGMLRYDHVGMACGQKRPLC